jgi:diguanylate cyclase (GGDEF)-like protein
LVGVSSSLACLLLALPSLLFSEVRIASRPPKADPNPAANVTPVLITKVAALRSLSAEQASRSIPVKVSGIVTALSGYGNSFFFQDATSGISVDRTDKADVQAGDLVEVTGASSPGLFAPIVMASYVKVVGHASEPHARFVTLGDLMGGAEDSQWIEVHGVVHSARISNLYGHDALILNLALGAGSINLKLRDFAGFDYLHLIDAKVRVRGVCSSDFNEKRQFVGLGMFVPRREDIEILEPANVDPFALQVTPVRNVLQFGQTAHRVKVAGISTYQIPGHALYLQDGKDGIRIQNSSPELVQAGMHVEAVGFPAMGDYAPMLEDGNIRVLGNATPISPLQIAAADVIAKQAGFDAIPYDGQLVQLAATLEESQIRGAELTWIVRQNKEVFTAHAPVSVASPGLTNIADGSLLSLTGICIVHADSDRTPISFSLLLRSPYDIVILKRASWWSSVHTLQVLAAFAGAMTVVILWVVQLRIRVEQQTRVIRASEGRFRNLAEHDVLTGLPNRLLLEDHIRQCLARCQIDRCMAAVLIVDVDRFKQINDTYGHPVGNECLKVIALRLENSMRVGDTVARSGGEEFTILVGGLASSDSARKIGLKILDLFQDSLLLPAFEIKLTVSVGGAIYPEDGLDGDTLRRRADQALFEAKRSGRNRAVFATETLSASLELETAIEIAIREGLVGDEFLLYYQPIYNGAGAICSFEALLRSSNPLLSGLGPARYIPVAEASGSIIPLCRWVLKQACRQIVEWQSMGISQLPIAVNVSSQWLRFRAFTEEVLHILKEHSVDPSLLELELTETAAMTGLTSVAETMTELAKSGITFAIDDFGTGYSSLARLHELPIKALKIDRSFVMNLESVSGFRTIIQAIIQMAKSMEIQVVAEGVETDAQFSILRELGCDLFQGYLFARPLAADAVIHTLAENRARVLADAS